MTVTLIEIVAALLLIVTSGVILAAVWLEDHPEAPVRAARAEDKEPEYPRAA
jgi:hypothetical protein